MNSPQISNPQLRGIESVFEYLPLRDGTMFAVYESHYSELARAYPDVNVHAELAAMRVWCNDNPRRRKSPGGIRRFIAGWLKREQAALEAARAMRK